MQLNESIGNVLRWFQHWYIWYNLHLWVVCTQRPWYSIRGDTSSFHPEDLAFPCCTFWELTNFDIWFFLKLLVIRYYLCTAVFLIKISKGGACYFICYFFFFFIQVTTFAVCCLHNACDIKQYFYYVVIFFLNDLKKKWVTYDNYNATQY